MSKLTVLEYANKHQISKQAVYARIKKGSIESIIENDKTFVYDDTKEVKQPKQKDDCLKLVKKLMKRIDRLEKQIDKEQDKSSSLLLAYVDEMKALYLPKPKSKKPKKKKKQ